MHLHHFTPAALLLFAHHALSHGHPSHDAEGDLTWSERHMQEEHHIYNFDSGAFFHLHDFDNSGTWTRDEVLRFYGLEQPDSTASEETKQHVWETVADLINTGRPDGEITMAEFQAFIHAGNTLPDFGLGPGHHGDPEYEYEIHHFEKYHNEDSTEEELNHPEDIEHVSFFLPIGFDGDERAVGLSLSADGSRGCSLGRMMRRRMRRLRRRSWSRVRSLRRTFRTSSGRGARWEGGSGTWH
jgi:hypothetical protein